MAEGEEAEFLHRSFSVLLLYRSNAGRAENESTVWNGVNQRELLRCSLGYAEAMATAIVGGSVIGRTEGWLSAWVGEELVMMRADDGTCISLSPTGARTWELLEEPRTLEGLVNELAAEYEAPHDEVRDDVLSFLNRLYGEGGITVQDGATL